MAWKFALFAFVCLVTLSCVTYAQEASLDVEDPYSGGMKMMMMKPKGGGGGGGSKMNPKPKGKMQPKPKMGMGKAGGKKPVHSSTGAAQSEHGASPAPVKASGTCQYVVKSGDTLSGIGGRVGVSYQTLAQINGIANPSLIHPGQVINYPCGGGNPTPPPPPSSPPASGGSCKAFADSQWNCVTPSCTSRVGDGAMQPSYMCAEFVARALASAGRIPGLSSMASQGAYANFGYNGRSYNLCWTSSRGNGRLGLEDFLQAAGWHNSGASTGVIGDCSVIFAYPGFSHVGIGVGNGQLDAHNKAHVGYAVGNWRSIISAVYNH